VAQRGGGFGKGVNSSVVPVAVIGSTVETDWKGSVAKMLLESLLRETRSTGWSGLDVIRDESAVRLVIDAPGVVEDSVAVDVDGSLVTVSFDRPTDREEKYLIEGRVKGRTVRRVRLNTQVDMEKASATLENGVLTVCLPLANPCRRIELSKV
jgi:HSP20 family molecular chaperone IbpA